MRALGLQQVWRVIIFVMGSTVMLVGVAMLVLPGPAFIVIPTGLAILGLEYRWARRWLKQAKSVLQRGVQTVSQAARHPPARDGTPPSSKAPTPHRE